VTTAKSDVPAALLSTIVCCCLLTLTAVNCPASVAKNKGPVAETETQKTNRQEKESAGSHTPEQQTTKIELAETQMPVYEPGKKLPKGMAESSVSIVIASEPANVWKALVSFEVYPQIFKRIKTSEITRRDGDFVFLETYLKPQMFIKNQVQHTISNIAASPNRLNWKQLDGNFKHVDGSWDLASVNGGKTNLTYTLHVDAGPLVPPSMVSFFLKFVQKEVVGQLKQYVEKEEKRREPHGVSRTKTNSN